MYQSPDVIKVKVNVEDVFASYGGGCPEDHWAYQTLTGGTCRDVDTDSFFTATYPTNPHQCYSTLNM